MAGADRLRLPRDSLGLAMPALLQESAGLARQRGWTRDESGPGRLYEPGSSISRLLRSSATASPEPREGAWTPQYGPNRTGEPQNTGNQIQLRPSMREVFGRNRDGQRGGDEGWNQGPGITMGEVFGRSRTQVEDQKGPNDGPTHLAPRAAMGAKFWKLERTILVNREPVQDEEYGTKATAPWMPRVDRRDTTTREGAIWVDPGPYRQSTKSLLF